jgi:hypothetical protein
MVAFRPGLSVGGIGLVAAALTDGYPTRRETSHEVLLKLRTAHASRVVVGLFRL